MDSTQMWWIAGGVVAVLLLVWLWMRYKKVSPAHMRPAQGASDVRPWSCIDVCGEPGKEPQCAVCQCQEICDHSRLSPKSRRRCSEGCSM